jgi:GNAT superfamily N-acetyltransferase
MEVGALKTAGRASLEKLAGLDGYADRDRARERATLRPGHGPAGQGFTPAAARLKDGRLVMMRLASDADIPAVQDFVRGLSAASRRSRFFAPVRELSPDQLERVTCSCQPHALAILAEIAQDAGTRIVALAQYASCEPNAAELAVVVDDCWQRQGLATLLLRALAEHAARGGLAAFTGFVLADNWPMLELLARHRCQLRAERDRQVIRAELRLDARDLTFEG